MPGNLRPHRLLLPRGAADPAALQQVALGRAGASRRAHRALPRLAPDAADLRRARGPQRPAQPRRDPVLGRLRLRRRDAATSTTTAAAAADCPRRVVRDRRRPERRPARRRLGARPPIDQLLDHPRIQDPLPTSAGGPEAAARQGGANTTHQGDPHSTPPTSTTTRRRATCAPTTCCRRGRAAGPRRRRLLADHDRPAVPPHRRLPVPVLRPPLGVGRRRGPGALTAPSGRSARPAAPPPRWDSGSGGRRGGAITLCGLAVDVAVAKRTYGCSRYRSSPHSCCSTRSQARAVGAGRSGRSWSIVGAHIRQASVTSSRISSSDSSVTWASPLVAEVERPRQEEGRGRRRSARRARSSGTQSPSSSRPARTPRTRSASPGTSPPRTSPGRPLAARAQRRGRRRAWSSGSAS